MRVAMFPRLVQYRRGARRDRRDPRRPRRARSLVRRRVRHDRHRRRAPERVRAARRCRPAPAPLRAVRTGRRDRRRRPARPRVVDARRVAARRRRGRRPRARHQPPPRATEFVRATDRDLRRARSTAASSRNSEGGSCDPTRADQRRQPRVRTGDAVAGATAARSSANAGRGVEQRDDWLVMAIEGMPDRKLTRADTAASTARRAVARDRYAPPAAPTPTRG